MNKLLFLIILSFAAVYSWIDVSAEMNDVQSNFSGSVGLAGFVASRDGNICAKGSAGKRIQGYEQLLNTTGDSRFHIGSVTKSMTAVLMATLLEKGIIAGGWDATLGDVIPALARGTAYANVSLRQLMGMQSGLAANPPTASLLRYVTSGKSVRNQRAEAASDAMVTTPQSTPGSSFLYSNWGYIVAGHIIEHYYNDTWEAVLAKELFAPLGICFGSHSFTGAPNDDISPWGTRVDGTACDPSKDEPCDNPPVYGPAGTFSGPNVAMAAYLGWHIRCHNGQDKTGILTRNSCQQLHQPANKSVQANYGYGLLCMKRSWAGGNGLACMHNGSNTYNYYVMWMGFGIQKAFAAFSNQFIENTPVMADKAIEELIQHSSLQLTSNKQCGVQSSYICEKYQ